MIQTARGSLQIKAARLRPIEEIANLRSFNDVFLCNTFWATLFLDERINTINRMFTTLSNTRIMTIMFDKNIHECLIKTSTGIVHTNCEPLPMCKDFRRVFKGSIMLTAML